VVQRRVDPVAAADVVLADAQAPLRQGLQHLGVRRKVAPVDGGNLVEVDAEGAPCGDIGVELPERAGGGVARVGEHLLARLLAPPVERVELVLAHVRLAPHHEAVGHGPGVVAEAEGDALDGLHVGRNLLARLAVPAGGALYEAPVLVDQLHGQPVKLGLGGIRDGVAPQLFAARLGEVAHLVLLVDGLQAEHGRGVGHRAQLVADRAAHLMGGGVGRLQPGVLGLKGLKLPEEPVVLGVGDDRGVEDVVAVVVVPERGAKLLGRLRRGRLGVDGRQVEVGRRVYVGHPWRLEGERREGRGWGRMCVGAIGGRLPPAPSQLRSGGGRSGRAPELHVVTNLFEAAFGAVVAPRLRCPARGAVPPPWRARL